MDPSARRVARAQGLLRSVSTGSGEEKHRLAPAGTTLWVIECSEMVTGANSKTPCFIPSSYSYPKFLMKLYPLNFNLAVRVAPSLHCLWDIK